MEISRVPINLPSSAGSPTRGAPVEAPKTAIPPVGPVLPTGTATDTVEIRLLAGRTPAELIAEIRSALRDASPERRSAGMVLLRAMAGHPAALQALPDLRRLWTRGSAAERAQAAATYRAVTGSDPEGWPAPAGERADAPRPAPGLAPPGSPVDRPAPADPAPPGTPPDPRGAVDGIRRSPARLAREIDPGAAGGEPPRPSLVAQQHGVIHALVRLPRVRTMMGGSLLAAGTLLYLLIR